MDVRIDTEYPPSNPAFIRARPARQLSPTALASNIYPTSDTGTSLDNPPTVRLYLVR